MERVSIYEAAGGETAFLALAAAHHARCLADPVLEHPFSHGVRSDHVQRLATYWAEVLGGPTTYSATYGGHSAVTRIHAGHGMGADLGERFVACFVAAADDAGLPDEPELRAALRAYMEWATRAMYAYDARDAVVPSGMAMPRWGWAGLEPSRPMEERRA
jgi:hemoglobin